MAIRQLLTVIVCVPLVIVSTTLSSFAGAGPTDPMPPVLQSVVFFSGSSQVSPSEVSGAFAVKSNGSEATSAFSTKNSSVYLNLSADQGAATVNFSTFSNTDMNANSSLTFPAGLMPHFDGMPMPLPAPVGDNGNG